MAKTKITIDQYKQALEDAWLGIYVDPTKLYNPLAEIPVEYAETPELFLMDIMSRPEYFGLIVTELLNLTCPPMQYVILQELWKRKFPMLIGSRGLSKTFCLALYCLIRGFLMPGRRILVTGSGFRQSKLVFQYMEQIWNNAPIFRDFCQSEGLRRETDRWRFYVGNSVITGLPVGTGDKIRGERANDLIVDEFASINQEIFEVVMAGFTAVAANPVENMKRMAKLKLAKKLNVRLIEEEGDEYFKSNQIIISGTAFYSFNHFCKYWEDWRQIVETGGDINRIKAYTARKSNKLIEDVQIDPNFKWDDYSVIRIPYELIPPGMMDAGQIARAKATIHSSLYNMEYGAIFPKDSDGFFKRSLVETCVASEKNNIIKANGPVRFNATLRGNINNRYVYGIDPASEVDNLALTIIERQDDHNRVVYAWTTNKRDHRERVKAGLINEDDFYAYCAMKIRELMQVFPPEIIGVDSQGGGFSIREALGRSALLKPGEQRVLEIIEPDNPKPTDGEAGLHILQMINFADQKFTGPANHGMRQDFEKQILLFPDFDAILLGEAEILDRAGNITYDNLEDCIMEIEELKNELASIVVTQTPSGRERWDVPEAKGTASQKKGYLRKDRYSALLIANYIARNLMDVKAREFRFTTGGWARTLSTKDKNDLPTGQLYSGPEVLVNKLRGLY
jgi:hypothetical protein